MFVIRINFFVLVVIFNFLMFMFWNGCTCIYELKTFKLNTCLPAFCENLQGAGISLLTAYIEIITFVFWTASNQNMITKRNFSCNQLIAYFTVGGYFNLIYIIFVQYKFRL